MKRPFRDCRVIHLMQGVAVGGMEKGVLQQIIRSRAAGFDDRLLLYDTPAGDAERDYDVSHVPVDFVGRHPGRDFGFALRLCDYLERLNARILHTHNHTALFYGALALKLMHRPRPALIGTFHSFPVIRGRLSRAAARWAAAQADAITSVSTEMDARLRAEGCTGKGVVILNGIDPDQFTPQGARAGLRAKLGLPEETLLIGHIGRFDHNKRQEDLIEAFRLLRERIPVAALVFIGQGANQQVIRQMIHAGEPIHILSRVPDVAALLRELDVFVLCSRHEGISRSLLEAMACGRAVVATGVGGTPELLGGGGECGLLVPPEDPPALAAAVAQLCASAARRIELGARARRRVESGFTGKATWENYEEIYRPALRW